MGNYSAALVDFARAIELQLNMEVAVYNTACVYALQRKVDPACTWLRKAIQMDIVNLDKAYTDREFDLIRDTPEFQAVLKEFDGTNESLKMATLIYAKVSN